MSWSVDDVIRQMDELIGHGTVRYVAASGSRLIIPALDGFRGRPRPIGGLRTDHVEPPLVELITRHIADRRRLDDRAGGGALSLRYVDNELHAVLDLLLATRAARTVSDSPDSRIRALAQESAANMVGMLAYS
ncbi:hypothetical protein [Actinoallomurus sp. NPDC052274]|uniref:hypothetical protein n=1 Tax=Actinoallomurus sp. NPDC052274 TaxID=3155420 RepID=UPI00341BE2A6